ncbi:MAG: choice-of-anchor D domain-containing protein [Candidatus Kapaibacterium sp.]
MSVRQIGLILSLFLFGALPSSAQSWKILTPRQVLPVPSDGTTVNFTSVSLISGMRYRVHASQRVSVSSGSDIADACYYVNIFPFAPGIVPVSMKVRTDASTEDWFYNYWNTSGFQNSYQPSHSYDASITSLGSTLIFRFFDTQEPSSSGGAKYYSDNTGSILVDVARETPGIAIENDTIDFGKVRVGTSPSIPDTIESYGMEGYKVDSVTLTGAGAPSFTVTSERALRFVITETTNEFRFTYSPSGNVRDSAQFHIFSSNGYGADREKIIYLYGQGFSADLTFSPDTLDFGTIKNGSTKMLPDTIINKGSIAAQITSFAPKTPGSPFSLAGALQTVGAFSKGLINVTFAPTLSGIYFEEFDGMTSDGTSIRFFAKGVSGVPVVSLEKTVLDFGQVVLKQSRTLTDQFGNIGSGALNVISTKNTNPMEYTILGNQGPVTYEPGHSIIYSITFSPQVHIPFCQNHDGKFTINYDDGTSSTITFLGCDHQPLDVKLMIDTFYLVRAGKIRSVSQRLINPGDPLDSTLTPTISLKERISYDATLFDLVSVAKGSLISAPDWILTTTMSTGAVDISINSATSHFGPAGVLLVLTFQAHDNDITGQNTDLVQSNINFNSPLEPFALTAPGRITISDICVPELQSGFRATSIEQNNPNPFNPTTHIQYAIGNTSDGSPVNVRITLYDQMGRFAGELINQPCAPGIYDYQFDGSAYPSGAYSYVFQVGDHVERKTMILVK